MSDRDRSREEEEFQSGEISEEDLEHVAAAGTSFNVTLDNKSNDESNSQVGVFQKPGTP